MSPLPKGIKNREDLSIDLKKNSFIAILLIDINNFHKINDQIGRENGDKNGMGLKEISPDCVEKGQHINAEHYFRILCFDE